MILITIGTQLPFDRLIQDMDAIAPKLGRPVFAQIGPSKYTPKSFQYERSLHPLKMDEMIKKADIIVSHAGIGSILTAQRNGKPIIIYPRLARFGEHRNDHQLATCDKVKSYAGVYTADSKESLFDVLTRDSYEPPVHELIAARQERFLEALGDHISQLRF